MTHLRGKRGGESRAKFLARKTVLAEAFWDHRLKESVALTCGGILQVERGDVLYDSKGYVHPSLKE
jgi:hypothetical protein